MATSCASRRAPYQKYKPRKPKKCDCSRWSYINPANTYYLYDETTAAGRA
ncbi:MAG: hypothetical protein R6W71_02400 [Bacteroidales bacterium]